MLSTSLNFAVLCCAMLCYAVQMSKQGRDFRPDPKLCGGLPPLKAMILVEKNDDLILAKQVLGVLVLFLACLAPWFRTGFDSMYVIQKDLKYFETA